LRVTVTVLPSPPSSA